jgi:hypothetical protein
MPKAYHHRNAISSVAAKQGPNVLLCMPTGTNCILFRMDFGDVLVVALRRIDHSTGRSTSTFMKFPRCLSA